MSNLPQAQIRVVDDLLDRAQQSVEVVVDGVPVASLLATAVKWEHDYGAGDGIARVTFTCIGGHADFDTRGPMR